MMVDAPRCQTSWGDEWRCEAVATRKVLRWGDDVSLYSCDGHADVWSLFGYENAPIQVDDG